MSNRNSKLLRGHHSQWQSQPTTVIRVPSEFKDSLISLAKDWDEHSHFNRPSLCVTPIISRLTKKAKNSLVVNNLNLGRKATHQVAQHPLCPFPYEDLEQQAFLALTLAADRFNPDRDIKFSTFATHQLKGRLLHYIRDKGQAVKVPRNFYELYFKAIKTDRISGSKKKTAEALGVDVADIDLAVQAVENCGATKTGVIENIDQSSFYYENGGLVEFVELEIKRPSGSSIDSWLSRGQFNLLDLRTELLGVRVEFRQTSEGSQ